MAQPIFYGDFIMTDIDILRRHIITIINDITWTPEHGYAAFMIGACLVVVGLHVFQTRYAYRVRRWYRERYR